MINNRRPPHSKFPIYLCFGICLIISFALFAQDSTPQKIISLGPAITRQLSILKAEDDIVGVTTYCEIKGKEIIGTVTDANIEKILLLKPDVVLATRLTNIRTIQKLENLNVKVEIFDEVKSFKQLCKQFLRLARIVGKEKIAGEIVSDVKEKVLGISLRSENLPRKKIIVQIGANPLWVATKDSLINDFIEMAGGINAGPEGETGLVSREYIVRQNPDVIIIIDMGIPAEEEKANWLKLENIKAVIEKRIHIIDSYGICSPTPLSFVETLKELSVILHSETE